jgi:GNAT superfamily N-acetyltransferase
MPLAENGFDYDAFILAKEKIWKEHGYGPWAFLDSGHFIGWGGLQPEGKDMEIALVLHPHHWGKGRAIYKMILDYAFKTLKLDSLIVLLPPSRNRIKGLFREGFEADGQVEIEGEVFLRYRKKCV